MVRKLDSGFVISDHPRAMGQDIYWYEVEWDKLLGFGDPECRLEAVTLALEEEDSSWLQELEIDGEWQSLNFANFLYFNDALEENAPEILRQLHSEFPMLKDFGVLWDQTKHWASIPTDLEADEDGILMASLAPQRVASLLASLKGIDRSRLIELMQKAVEADAVDKIFESGEDFVSFVEAFTKGFEGAVRGGRGILVFLSY